MKYIGKYYSDAEEGFKAMNEALKERAGRHMPNS
jgi:hypothetical protein